MSTDVFAGQLCATQVGEWVQHPELDPTVQWICVEVRHSQRHTGPLLVAQSIDPIDGRSKSTTRCLYLGTDEIVTFSVR